MNTKKLIVKLAKKKLISKKPKPIYVFILFFTYFIIWIFTLISYIKFNTAALKFCVIAIGILTFLTLIHAIIHEYIVKVLEQKD